MNILSKKTRAVLLSSVLVLPSCITKTTPNDTASDNSPKPAYIQVAQRDAVEIGQKIWMNESSGKREGLTAWNVGETFASLGIGHFIWYPYGQEGPFHETFPNLVNYIKNQGIMVPQWLTQSTDCPWNTREAFQADFYSPKMQELRSFMERTIPQQVQFIIQRLEKALPSMLATLPTQQRTHIKAQFDRVAQISQGVYALIDYVNFKGEGINPNERYQGQGWGLLQVLQYMTGNTLNPMKEFADSAETVLKRRIQNSPPERNESRWLAGWKNRLQTYLQ